MKLSFMTLGCPSWDLDTICSRGRAYGFEGVDFRGYLGELDVTKLPAFTTGAAATRRRLSDAGLAVSAISSSIQVCSPESRAANRDEARRTIDVARGMGAGIVRIFGGGDLSQHSRAELARAGCAVVEEILALDGAAGLRWLFETHDLWIKAADCRLLLDSIPSPAFGALWDMGHTSRVGGETPRQTWDSIGPRVGYCHVKDAVYEPGHPKAMDDGWRYVAPGTGTLPLGESIGTLKENRWDGWLLFEHEKRWHPDLPEPEEIFPLFVKWARPLVAA
jgi:sugar phosphate isomerase/epimerase